VTHELITRIREHAAAIRAMSETEAPRDKSGKEASNVRTWRALVVENGQVISLRIAKAQGMLGFAEVTRRFSTDSAQTVQQISNATGLTPEDIAVFLGLDAVDPEDVSWTEVTIKTPSQLFIAQGDLRNPKLN